VIVFIVICEVLAFVALAWVLLPLWRTQLKASSSAIASTDRAASLPEKGAVIAAKSSITLDQQARLAVYKDRRQEIASELELGRLSAEEAQRQQEDLMQEVAREFGETEIVSHSPVNRKSALVLGCLGAALAALIYMTVGMPHLVENIPGQAAQADGQDPAKLISELEMKISRNPSDAPSWAILGAAYKYTGQLSKSVNAFEKFFALEPALKKESARPLAEFAEVLALSKDSNFSGRPIELLSQALKLDPTEPKSLAMMGAAQFRAGNLPDAKRYLTQLLAQMPPDSPQAQQLKPLVERIDEQLRNPNVASPAQGGTPTDESASLATKPIITGKLVLAANAKSADALKDVKAIFVSVKLPPEENSAKNGAAASPRSMPVAALKIDQNFSADRWPLSFSLADDQSLRPQLALSKAGPVVLEVHLSRSGLPGKSSGDWFGKVGPFKPGAALLEVKVDQRLP
jgi:cytochrome c-type biogenesis protein CcmH